MGLGQTSPDKKGQTLIFFAAQLPSISGKGPQQDLGKKTVKNLSSGLGLGKKTFKNNFLEHKENIFFEKVALK